MNIGTKLRPRNKRTYPPRSEEHKSQIEHYNSIDYVTVGDYTSVDWPARHQNNVRAANNNPNLIFCKYPTPRVDTYGTTWYGLFFIKSNMELV